MALPLAQFPNEILSLVTSYLSDIEVASALHLCGNALLSRKISQSTLFLSYTSPTLPPGRLARISTFTSLRELELSQSTFRSIPLRRLFNTMPQCLRKLYISHSHSMELVRQDLTLDEATDPALLPFRSQNSRAIILSERFPHLEHLSLLGSRETEWNRGLVIRFVCGLPPSLTYLNVPSLFLGFSIWPILPPNLTFLAVAALGIPLKENGGIPSTPFASLRALSIILPKPFKPSTELHFSEKTALDGSTRHFLPQYAQNVSELILPSQLTYLNLTAPSPSEPPHFLPPTLRSLTWNGMDAELLDVSVLLDSIPLSVEELRLTNWRFASKERSRKVVTRPLTRLLELGPRDPSCSTDLIFAFPNLKVVALRTFKFLQKEHFEFLNPRTLYSLECTIDLKILNAPGSPGSPSLASEDADATDSLFAKQFPNLRVLNLMVAQGTAFSPPLDPNGFSFACVPPSVTHLRVGPAVTATTLHLIPESVKTLYTSRAFHITNKLTPNRFYSLFFPTTEVGELDLQTLELGASTNFCRRALKSTPIVDNKTLLPETSFWFPKSETDGTRFKCGPEVNLPLPPTLTCLSNQSEVILTPVTFNPIALPCLRKLSLESLLPDNLSAFPSLKSLSVLQFLDLKKGDLPPTLTTLKVQSRLNRSSLCIAREGFLPSSLEKLEFGSSNALDQLEHLTNLKSLRMVHTQLSEAVADQLKAHPLPKSITQLRICPTSVAGLLRQLVTLPLIQNLHIGGIGLSFYELEEILSILGPKGTLIGGRLHTIEDPVSLALSVNTQSGGLTPKDTLINLIYELSRLRFPQWKPVSAGRVSSAFSGSLSWSRFALLLSPTLVELKITLDTPVPRCFAAHLPRTLKVLHVDCIESSQFYCTRDLPPGLLELNMNAIGFGLETYVHLPRTLTSLELPHQKKFVSRYAKALPPQLTSLLLSPNTIPFSALKALPPSVTKLRLEKVVLSREVLEALPATVKQLQMPYNHRPEVYYAPLFDFAVEKGMAWISTGDMNPQAPNMMLSRIAALDEHIDRFLHKEQDLKEN